MAKLKFWNGTAWEGLDDAEKLGGQLPEYYATDSDLDGLAGEGRTIETVKGNADDIGDLADDLSDLAGEGHTTETVKGNADTISDHLTDYGNYKEYLCFMDTRGIRRLV